MEKGTAEVAMELKDGDITIRRLHNGKKGDVLLHSKNVKEGSWEKLFKTITEMSQG